MTLTVNKMNGQGTTVLATEGPPNSSNKMECLSYKGEWVNRVVTYLKEG